jgi:hypothetical protein
MPPWAFTDPRIQEGGAKVTDFLPASAKEGGHNAGPGGEGSAGGVDVQYNESEILIGMTINTADLALIKFNARSKIPSSL